MPEQFLKAGNELLHLNTTNPRYKDIIEQERKMREAAEQDIKLWTADRTMDTGEPFAAAEYWDVLLDRLDSTNKLLMEAFMLQLYQQKVLDLGCGDIAKSKITQRSLKKYAPSTYIGVDSRIEQVDKDQKSGMLVHHLSIEDGDELEGVLIKGDLLDVTSRLQQGEFSIALNAVDNDEVNVSSDYGRDLTQEVFRILSPIGLLFGYTNRGGILTEISNRTDIHSFFIPTKKTPTGEEAGFYILQKGRSSRIHG